MLPIDKRLLWALVLWLFSSTALAADLEVENPRLRLLPGDLPAAGYYGLRNTSDETMVLVGAQSPAFARVMLHRSVEDDGQVQMRHVPRLVIESGDSVDFAPGGYHLMLMERSRPLAVGDEVTVTLEFEDGRRLPVAFRAVSPASL
ncbi:copper chaperone PCu(A)C [Halomonas ramblicola]|uniref:copper chaperone PCu(A)C n=1 Tax=Halomonas ramblicola TaxID=747349 RepID=UPI0025B28256|nr:copper chaperone PCu(A)C [Halomonas ramblicola]MDN3521129.1 copper chaperone PCu(A)C [Halomonas ramblicola]